MEDDKGFKQRGAELQRKFAFSMDRLLSHDDYSSSGVMENPEITINSQTGKPTNFEGVYIKASLND